jgi:hypothetical protein
MELAEIAQQISATTSSRCGHDYHSGRTVCTSHAMQSGQNFFFTSSDDDVLHQIRQPED